MKFDALNKLAEGPDSTAQMPVLFLGHGTPMNAIEENEFVKGFRSIQKTIPIPKAILCISAHWETKGTYLTAMDKPPTIHDFGGFPAELFNVQYPAPGDPELAGDIQKMTTKTEVCLDFNWGLDHGAWSVIKHLYPEAGIPVIQMSLDYLQNPGFHYELGAELSVLRNKGILIIGSGNMVHNLRILAWNRLNEEFGYDWALEAGEKIKELITKNDHKQLINFRSLGKAFDLSIPSHEHYLPLLYILAMKNTKDEITFFNDKTVGGSVGMTSVRIGE
jgi:4,5-DOPA dioxygenase extradiol